jgi:hypothetical protein
MYLKSNYDQIPSLDAHWMTISVGTATDSAANIQFFGDRRSLQY